MELYRSTELLRVYSPVLVPGLLQTEGYARALLSSNARFLGVPDDAVEAAAARLERSQIIHEPGHRFVMVIEEAVLYYQFGDADAMAAQFGYLLTAGALPAVSFGIIPMSTRERALWPQETFDVHDDTLVSVELISAEVNVTEPSEIALYIKAFEQLRSMAVYGAEARALDRQGDRGARRKQPDSEPELWVMLGKLGGSRHHAPSRRPARLDRRLPLTSPARPRASQMPSRSMPHTSRVRPLSGKPP